MALAALPVLVALSSTAAPAAPPPPAPPLVRTQDETESEGGAQVASADVLARLLDDYESAAAAKEAPRVFAALVRMRDYGNPELLEPALSALKYKASSADKKAAKAEAEELGIRSKSKREELLFQREADVRAAAARVLANQAGDKSVGALRKALKDKQNRKERPSAIASVVDALGRLGCRDAEAEIEDEFNAFRNPEVVKACVLYFGRVKSKRYSIVRALCEQLSPPQPASVDAASNPPAGYWEMRWKMWMNIRRDVSWALKEITGQVFEPAEGEHEGDAKKALEYVKSHKRELGLR
ncbi:MAG: hypothetical protein AAF682_16710 [Planctomycetota bacterium]